jgi:SAM-dependent methyltransferase
MTEWGGGYITDVGYLPGFYRLQTPGILSLACMLNGVPGLDPTSDEPMAYVELGCGLGYTAMVVAACNPDWQVFGIDFNPAHIAEARQFVREARLANIRFIEADLTDLADVPGAAAVPEADIVTMHGLWSWVAPKVRRGVLRLLRAKVRPGGIVHTSYNALPGWQSALGLQRALREAGRRTVGRSDRQAEAGLRFVQSLLAAGAGQIKGSEFATQFLEKMLKAAAPYVAHEMMNENWTPSFHADVVADFAEAKLDWVGSASLYENFRQLTLADEQRALADAAGDPLMVELIKDMCLSRGFRQDVFVRGARRVSTAERNAMLGEVILALTCLPEHFQSEAMFPVGKATMEAAFYGPIIAALHEHGPMRVRDLIALPEVVGRRDNPAELIAMLVSTDQATPVTPRPARGKDPAMRFNRATATRAVRQEMGSTMFALASAGLGTALNAPGVELMAFHRLAADPEDADVETWVRDMGANESDTGREKLRAALEQVMERRVPVWRRLGILN